MCVCVRERERDRERERERERKRRREGERGQGEGEGEGRGRGKRERDKPTERHRVIRIMCLTPTDREAPARRRTQGAVIDVLHGQTDGSHCRVERQIRLQLNQGNIIFVRV